MRNILYYETYKLRIKELFVQYTGTISQVTG